MIPFRGKCFITSNQEKFERIAATRRRQKEHHKRFLAALKAKRVQEEVSSSQFLFFSHPALSVSSMVIVEQNARRGNDEKLVRPSQKSVRRDFVVALTGRKGCFNERPPADVHPSGGILLRRTVPDTLT